LSLGKVHLDEGCIIEGVKLALTEGDMKKSVRTVAAVT